MNTRLREHIHSWLNISAPEYIINWIVYGVELPFDTVPNQFELPNRQLSPHDNLFVDEEIVNLLRNQAIREVDFKPHCVSPISVVPKKNNKKRLVIDLRAINNCLSNPYFRNEGIEVAKQYIQPNDRMVTFDLKDGYHHIPLHEKCQTFLGFKWREKYYVWQVCPFGLSSSGYFFNKVIRAIVQYYRQQDIRLIFFVDDGILFTQQSTLTDHYDMIIHGLQELGLKINFEKSCLQPKTSVEWIGYILNSVGHDHMPWIYIPKKRITKLRHDINRTLIRNHLGIKARHLARITGQCISMCKAVIPAKLKLRNLYKILRQRISWQSTLYLDEHAIQDLKWWYDALDNWNGAPATQRPVDIQIETDASGYGWGAVCGNRRAAGTWDRCTSLKPSNYRELLAVLLAIKSFATCLTNKRVQVLCDNVAAVANINKLGGPSSELSRLTQALWATTHSLGIDLSARHLAGSLNIQADRLSRQMSQYEWKLHPQLFRFIDKYFGPHHVDRFASLRTTQLPRYNSLMWDPETEGVDALAQNWRDTNNFINAPFKLLPRILAKIQEEATVATIIAPDWPAQPWYNKLCSMSIRMPIPIPNHSKTMLRLGVKPEPLRNRKWRLYAWKVCGDQI